jgi:predicted phosphate transport protein (TIGR00153 family)
VLHVLRARTRAGYGHAEGAMLGFLVPKDSDFFAMLDEHAATSVEAAKRLIDLLEHYTDVHEKVARIHAIEHQADEIGHKANRQLHKTFITPIDREQIHQLFSCMDDVVDLIDGAARRLLRFNVAAPRPDLVDMAMVLLQATLAMQSAVANLRDMKKAERINQLTIEINKLENDSDALRDAAVGRLFKEERDAIEVLKWREIYETVESAVDRCEDTADVIEGIVIENE